MHTYTNTYTYAHSHIYRVGLAVCMFGFFFRGVPRSFLTLPSTESQHPTRMSLLFKVCVCVCVCTHVHVRCIRVCMYEGAMANFKWNTDFAYQVGMYIYMVYW